MWHYHEQLELVVILRSTGTRFVGNSIEQFSEGEIVLLGKDLPHMWLNDKPYFQEGSDLVAEAIAIHFKEDFLCSSVTRVPEFKALQLLLENARQGLKFTGDNSDLVMDIKGMLDLDEFDRVLQLLKILKKLSEREATILSKNGFNESTDAMKHKMDEVFSYIFNNFKKQITLAEVAGIVNMHPTAFSRFFKKASHKTFSRYLNEIRVGYACKLILEQRYPMADICFEAGFNNISNFNRQFKAITAQSPTEYLEGHRKLRQN
ncbi:MAG: helix-turn-helix domain-containing protein [Lewinella sp.]|nr:helix-turn-helix domain-containing protein [Lewinella sp.]